MEIYFFGKDFGIRLAIMATVFLLLSCNASEKDQIQGDWYSFDKDSVYFELYINDTMIVLNQPQIGPVGYDYEVKDDRLIVSNSVGMERIWKLEEITSASMTMSDSLERLQYFRLNVGKSFFNSLVDSASFREFSENFNTRFAVQSKK
ncbi:hypothetical protein [Mariniradius sediminis]|uniref:Uncharacterized protein n=1 Tax=Mariniradius sediminis TaxID=2909237 RepID=A0ABS9BXM6_9BACT|nr:hypothetical protein [Mariniradius sediminis]MCF1752497.1 hypothetical protein [Mariniradius sediminis]